MPTFRIPTLIAAVLLAALMVAVVAIRPGDRVHRALGRLLLARAAVYALLVAETLERQPWHNLAPYAFIGTIFATFDFVILLADGYLPEALRPGRNRRRLLRLITLAGFVVTSLYYLLSHERSQAFSREHVTDLFLPLSFTSLAIAAVAIVAIAGRLPPGLHRKAAHTLALGLVIEPIYQGAVRVLFAVPATDGLAFSPASTPLAAASLLVSVATLGIGLLGAVLLLRHADVGPQRTRRGPIVAFASLAVLIPILVHLTRPLLSNRQWFVLFTTGDAVWVVLFAAAIVYGALRYRLFGIDLSLRHTLRGFPIAGVLAFTFFVVSETIENVVGSRQDFGDGLSILVAVVIAASLRPVHRIAERIARRAFPGVDDSEGYRRLRKAELYRMTLEDLLQDGIVTEEERRVLDRLRARLALDAEEADQLEAEVTRHWHDPGEASRGAPAQNPVSTP